MCNLLIYNEECKARLQIKIMYRASVCLPYYLLFDIIFILTHPFISKTKRTLVRAFNIQKCKFASSINLIFRLIRWLIDKSQDYAYYKLKGILNIPMSYIKYLYMKVNIFALFFHPVYQSKGLFHAYWLTKRWLKITFWTATLGAIINI